MASSIGNINDHQRFMIIRKRVSLQELGLNLKSGIELKQIFNSKSNIGEICVFSKDCRNDLHVAAAIGTAG